SFDHLSERLRRRQGGQQRQLRHRSGRSAGRGGRIRLGQERDRPVGDAPRAAAAGDHRERNGAARRRRPPEAVAFGDAPGARHARDLLGSVGLSDPEAVMNRYAFETTAGDAQRVMLAIALAGDPDLLIADEPTSLLDAVAQDEILTLLKEVQARTGMAVWLIT